MKINELRIFVEKLDIADRAAKSIDPQASSKIAFFTAAGKITGNIDDVDVLEMTDEETIGKSIMDRRQEGKPLSYKEIAVSLFEDEMTSLISEGHESDNNILYLKDVEFKSWTGQTIIMSEFTLFLESVIGVNIVKS